MTDEQNNPKIADTVKKGIKIKIFLTVLVVSLILAGLAGYLVWEKIENSTTELKIGFVTDWEYGYKDNVGDKLASLAPAELEKVVKYYNEEYRPKIVVAGGDMVESSLSKKETTIKQLEKINGIFSRLEARREYVFGNHDLRDLTKGELRSILGLADNHSYFDLGDWRFVLMDTNFRKKDDADLGPDYYIGGYISQKEYIWLETALTTNRPTIIFSHHSPIPSPDKKNLTNQVETRAFLEQFPNLVLVVSGHDPSCLLKEENGINYFIVNNLVDRKALGSFATINAYYNKYTKEIKIELEQHGTQKEKFKIKKQFYYDKERKNKLVSFIEN